MQAMDRCGGRTTATQKTAGGHREVLDVHQKGITCEQEMEGEREQVLNSRARATQAAELS